MTVLGVQYEQRKQSSITIKDGASDVILRNSNSGHRNYIKLKNKSIKYKNEVKYLGVVMDCQCEKGKVEIISYELL